ncbi:MAG: hypothetical protein FWG63_03125 [Defluviitaleaceae bacterium]|nr:hypothetical protein [Defluviitaleaceae bacterium]
MDNEKIKYILKIFSTSAVLICIVTFVSVVYTFFGYEQFFLNNILNNVFNANFVVGAFIIAIGITLLILPARLGSRRLIDHTTYVSKIIESREAKGKKSRELIYIGMTNIMIVAVVQYLLWLILTVD